MAERIACIYWFKEWFMIVKRGEFRSRSLEGEEYIEIDARPPRSQGDKEHVMKRYQACARNLASKGFRPERILEKIGPPPF